MRKTAWFFFILTLSLAGCGGDKSSPEDNSQDSGTENPPTGQSETQPGAAIPGSPTTATEGDLLPEPPKPAPKTDHLPGGYQLARPAIEQFLAAPSLQERLALIYTPNAQSGEVEAYYAKHPDEPVSEFNLRFLSMDESPADGDFPLYVFTLNLPGHLAEFPVTVRKTTEGMKVDWGIFTEFRDDKFRKFIDSGSDGPERLRVILQRQSFWGDDRDAMADHLSFRLMTMDPAVELFAFVPKDSGLVETMNEFYGWGVGPIAATVVVERRPFPHGQSHFVITRLASHPLAGDGWHLR